MNNQDIPTQIDSLNKQVKYLERVSIQESIDPTTSLYLAKSISAIVSTLPTQTYSTTSPSGTAPVGSLWMEDTGTLATNKIYVYDVSGWIRMK